MTLDEARRRHAARPFQPFPIHLADRRAFKVASPGLLAQSIGGALST